MIYFGENNEYILCECETCKGEMYIERNSISDEDAYAYHLYAPVKCRCGAVDEYINRAKKSCHRIKQELFALSDLIHKQQNVSNKISEITSELNKKFEPPSFLQSVGKDVLFAGKVFLILLGAAIGVEIFLFIVTALMFFFGLVLGAEGIAVNGNELFYNINIFKESGGNFLSKFGFDAAVKPLNEYGTNLAEGLVAGYIPAAIAGLIIIVFYVFLAVLVIRVSINIAKLTFFASKVMNQKIKINQKREEYQKHLDELSVIYQNLGDQISEVTIIPQDYRNMRATDLILKYFITNRIDTIKEAINLYHEEDFRNRLLEYTKAMYNETRQTRRYTKALYMMTSDENIKVDIKDTKEDTSNSGSENDGAQVGEMLKGAFTKIKKPAQKKISRIPPPQVSSRHSLSASTYSNSNSEEKKKENIEEKNTTNEFDEFSEFDEIGELQNLSVSNEPAENINDIDDDNDNINIAEIFEQVNSAEFDESSESGEQDDSDIVLDSVPPVD